MFLFFYAFMIFYVQLCRRFRKQNMHCEQRRCCFMLFLSNSEVSTVPHLYPFVTILNCRLLNLREQELRCYLRHWTHHWQAAVGFRTSTWRECFLYFTSSSLINLYFIQWEFQDPKMEVLYHICHIWYSTSILGSWNSHLIYGNSHSLIYVLELEWKTMSHALLQEFPWIFQQTGTAKDHKERMCVKNERSQDKKAWKYTLAISWPLMQCLGAAQEFANQSVNSFHFYTPPQSVFWPRYSR